MKLEYSQLNVLINGNAYTQVVCVCMGQIVGTVDIDHYSARSASIRRLYVDKDARLKGIGRELLHHCELIAQGSGARNIGLNVDAGNREVIGFYEKCGYSIAFEYNDGDVLMTKQLR